jgi:adenylate cyclase
MPAGERIPRYCLADLHVDVGRRTVTRGTSDIRLSKLSFELLRTLIEAAPNLVSNGELARAVWRGVIVGPETVTQRVKLLRDALDDDAEAPRYIVGLRGQGYRILPEVTLNSAKIEAEALQTAARPAKSIAVLPFLDLSEKHDQEYFADGMAEEIIDRLAQTPGLRVIARASSFYFRGKNERITTIAKELGVAHMLEGSVRKAGERVRVVAALVRGEDGAQIWSECYNLELQDVFAVQDQIAGSVASALRFTLAGPASYAARGGTTNVKAYQSYLRGKSNLYENSPQSLDAAGRQLQEALLLDPKFALAASRLAQVALLKTNNNLLAAKEGFELTRSLAERALDIDPDLADAHLWLGYVYRTLDWNWPAAATEFQRVLRDDAANVDAMMFSATLYKTLGQWSSGQQLLQCALELDPLNTFVLYNLGDLLYLSNRFPEAEAVFRRLLASTPNFQWTRPRLAMTLLAENKPQEALALMEQIDNVGRIIPWPSVLLANGRTTDADQSLQDLMAAKPIANAYYVAANFAYRNDADHAFEWLEKAYAHRETALISDMTNEPFFANIRHDPRFGAFRRRMNLSE